MKTAQEEEVKKEATNKKAPAAEKRKATLMDRLLAEAKELQGDAKAAKKQKKA